jgi:hypothetical protein
MRVHPAMLMKTKKDSFQVPGFTRQMDAGDRG